MILMTLILIKLCILVHMLKMAEYIFRARYHPYQTAPSPHSDVLVSHSYFFQRDFFFLHRWDVLLSRTPPDGVG